MQPSRDRKARARTAPLRNWRKTECGAKQFPTCLAGAGRTLCASYRWRLGFHGSSMLSILMSRAAGDAPNRDAGRARDRFGAHVRPEATRPV